jgi:glycerol-3-phosphate dehydrogenase
MHHLLGPGQATEVTVNEHAVEAVVYKEQQAAKQLSERLQRSSPLRAIAFEFSWQANVSGCCNDSIEASFVKGHDFSQAAKRTQKEAGL